MKKKMQLRNYRRNYWIKMNDYLIKSNTSIKLNNKNINIYYGILVVKYY